MKVHNNTQWTVDEIRGFKFIHAFTNNWRQRFIEIYQHPTAENRVLTIGSNLDKSAQIVCDEHRDDYKREIENNITETH